MKREYLDSVKNLYLEDFQSACHRSLFANEGSYSVLITRGLELSETGLGFTSKGYVITKEGEVFTYERQEERFTPIKGGISSLYEVLSPTYARNVEIIEGFVDEIDQLEDSLFERKASRIFMDIWFDLKKDLARIERHLQRNLLVLKSFHKSFKGEENFQESRFNDLINDVFQDHSSTGTQLSRLDALYNYHNSIKNDRLNKNLFLLTILSAIFLPLNLIVGFFGMNTENLFFQGDPEGTNNVLMILLASLGFSIFGLPVIRFVDHHILKIFLGRYDLYKKVSGKIGAILKID